MGLFRVAFSLPTLFSQMNNSTEHYFVRHLAYFLGLICTLFALNHTAVFAQDYPERPIRWIVPYPAGGGTDVFARTLADSMQVGLKQPLIIENRPGASTNIGIQELVKSPPDGYVIASADNAALAFNEYLFSRLPYRPAQDFTYIGAIGRWPLLLAVHPSLPVRTVAEFIAYMKANPSKASYASPGNGSPHHIAMEMFKQRSGVDLLHAPYRGAAPALQDLAGGQIATMMVDLGSSFGLLKAGKIRAIAVASPKRIPNLPDIPTMAESGVTGAEAFAFQGIIGPAGLSPAIVARLNKQLNQSMQEPAVIARFADFGTELTPGTPEDFFKVARAQAEHWGKVIRAVGITLD